MIIIADYEGVCPPFFLRRNFPQIRSNLATLTVLRIGECFLYEHWNRMASQKQQLKKKATQVDEIFKLIFHP